MEHSYILISGSDDRGPKEILGGTLEAFLGSPYLEKWYVESPDFSHAKIESLPTGIYPSGLPTFRRAARLHELRKNGLLLPAERPPRVLCAFRLSHKSRADSREICSSSLGATIEDELKDTDFNTATSNPGYIGRRQEDPAFMALANSTFNAMAKYAFVLCPRGVTLDSHRTTEALLAGSIPIVQSSISSLDEMYRAMGAVVIVNNWDEITESSLNTWIERFGPQFEGRKGAIAATQGFWLSRIFGNPQLE